MSMPAERIRSEITACYWGGGRRFFTQMGAARNEAKALYHKLRQREEDEPIDYGRRECFVANYAKRLLRRPIIDRFVSPFAASTIAEKVLGVRDALIVARANRKAAKESFREMCRNMYINREGLDSIQKFEREIGENYVGKTVISWWATKEFTAFDPSAEQYAEDCTNHPDFVAMCKANEARHEANKACGIALRRLLSIGVKRKVAA